MQYFIDNTNRPKAIFYSDRFQQTGYKLGINQQAGLNLRIVILFAQRVSLYSDNSLQERIRSAQKVSPDGTYSTNKMLNFRNDVANKKVSGFAMGFAATYKTEIDESFRERWQKLFSSKKLVPKFDAKIVMDSGLTRTALAIASNIPHLPVLIDDSSIEDLMVNNLCCAKFGYPRVSELFDKNSSIHKEFCDMQHPEIGNHPILIPR